MPNQLLSRRYPTYQDNFFFFLCSTARNNSATLQACRTISLTDVFGHWQGCKLLFIRALLSLTISNIFHKVSIVSASEFGHQIVVILTDNTIKPCDFIEERASRNRVYVVS